MLKIASLVLTLAASPVLAQETGGTITGTLNGQKAEWRIDPSQSDFSGFSGFSGMRTISLYAKPINAPDNVGVLTIGFETNNNSASSPEAIIFAGKGSFVHIAHEDNAKITLTREEENDGFLVLEGSFSGTLSKTSDYGRTIDETDTYDLKVEFSGVVEVLGH